MLQKEHYWHRRALGETTAALRSDDPHVAALHVELATHCVRNALAEREREEQGLSTPANEPLPRT